jgi:hypothetical protein
MYNPIADQLRPFDNRFLSHGSERVPFISEEMKGPDNDGTER